MLDKIYSIYRPLFALFVAVNTSLIASSVIVLTFFEKNGNLSYYMGKFWGRLNLFMAGIRIRIRGLENVETGKPYIVMTNHQSHCDVWVTYGYLPLKFRWIMKIELKKIPIFGTACERMGHIYIDRRNPEKAKKSLELAGEKIRSGTSIVMFPEGTRSVDGTLREFKKGGFIIAISSGVPILPVTINGSEEALPKGSWLIRPVPMEMIIHKPIAVDKFTLENKEKLIRKVRKTIEGGLA